jgi:cardiolipin synthase
MVETNERRLSRERRTSSPFRLFADRALARAAGAHLIRGNSVRILKDAKENYPAWLDAIRLAKSHIHFESFIIHEDDIGWQFAEALGQKAREGVQVRLLYDWYGDVGYTSRRFWRALRDAGVEVRRFNPPRFDSPLGWMSRDHRKMLAIDGNVGFVFGLCLGRRWVGYPERGIEGWRDTGVELLGPAIAEIEKAFSDTWSQAGGSLPPEELPGEADIPAAGDMRLRVIASAPNTAGLYRLDHLIAAGARNTLWLTDAYFVGTTTYIQALRSASLDGVDVRLLVPSSSDVPLFRAISRASYRPLLEAGVRVFEWNGPMLHAKTAVADTRWARVGSTNLNLSSWIGNWELDVAVEDQRFALAMEEMYLEDLGNATEIILSEKMRIRPASPRRKAKGVRLRRGGARGVAAGALGVGSAVSAAITNRRLLGPAEAKVMGAVAIFLVILATVAVLWPRAISVPLAVIGLWVAIGLGVRAYRLRRIRTERD